MERHALNSLAADPGMRVGLMNLDALAQLAVVTCGAAKADLYAAAESRALTRSSRYLSISGSGQAFVFSPSFTGRGNFLAAISR